jgi:tetratricopeptide (TPR) repeat protein
MFYWNARKTVFRLRGDRGTCPCQNPSDSGEPMQTGCEAIYGWRHAARFQRVCPLLRQNPAGQWVCSVRAQDVRPFWGRAFGYIGGTIGVVVLCGVLSVFGLMRAIGYEVSVRQIVWPPAWHELREVRSQLFIKKAREAYSAGRVREALNALLVAYEMDPANYSVGMMLAQFYQAGNPSLADTLYARLLREHPDHRMETARVWFRSLLARGRMRGIVELSRRQLTTEPQQASAWVHALVFATRHLQDPRPLESAAQSEKLPATVRETLRLAARVQQLPPAEARDLLVIPSGSDFPYDRVYRIETLTRLGFTDEAFELLLKSRGQIAGRDMARLAFALYALKGDTARLDREFAALLAPTRALHPYEVSLLAIHLVNWPDPGLLVRVCEAFGRMSSESLEVQLEIGLAVFCAAGVQRNQQLMTDVQSQMTRTTKIPLASMNRLGLYFMNDAGKLRIENLLPQQNSLSLELNYALLDRYLSKN